MTTKALREALMILDSRTSPARGAWERGDDAARKTLVEAMAELEAIERAAKDFDRLSVGDFTWNIRDRVASDRHFNGDTWEHPDVKAFSDASELMGHIAESAPMTPLYPGVDES